MIKTAESEARKRDLLLTTLRKPTPELASVLMGVEGEGREVLIVSLILVNPAAEAFFTEKDATVAAKRRTASRKRLFLILYAVWYRFSRFVKGASITG